MIFRYHKVKINFLLNSFILISGFLFIISIWSYRNFHKFDTFQLSGRGGLTLWMAADQLDDSYSLILKNIVFNFSEYIGSRIFKEDADKPNEVILARANNYHLRIYELKSLGHTSSLKIEKIMTDEALKKIIEKPIIYSLQRFLELEKMISFLYIPSLNLFDRDYLYKNDITKSVYFQNFNFGNTLLALIKFPFKILSYFFFMMSIYTMIKLRKNFKDIYFLIAIIFYTNFIYSMLFGLGRYAVPLIPYYVILSSWAFSELYKNKKKI